MHIQVAGVRTDHRLTGTVRDATDLLCSLARINLRQFRADPHLAEEILRRVCTPPCVSQCFVMGDKQNGLRMQGCSCTSGIQYTSDPDAQKLEGCAPADVWSDARALLMHHKKTGRGDNDAILCDCDDITALCAAIGAYLAWDRGADPEARFAVAITRPPPPKDNMAHAYGLLSKPPVGKRSIRIVDDAGDVWYVFDGAEHWGMPGPNAGYYTTGEVYAFEIKHADLDGLFASGRANDDVAKIDKARKRG